MILQKTKRLQRSSVAIMVIFFIFLFSSQIGAAPSFIGNIIAGSTPANFSQYWNQVTSENAGKWGSAESTRDSINWGTIDSHYNYAHGQGYPYKFHVLVWGNQQPSWISGLSTSDQLAEVTEWIQAAGGRYNCEMWDVVNEPLHAQPSYKNALGGDGSTGWDWVIRSFELANQYCSGTLLINEYGIVSDNNATSQYLTIINLLRDRGLVDGIGIQTHCFNMDTVAVSTLQSILDSLANTGLGLYSSELDMRGDDNTQLQRYQEKFPVLYNHSSMRGITLWGYITGQTWKDQTGLISSGSVGATERPALTWLKQNYLGGTPSTTTSSATSTTTSTASSTTTSVGSGNIVVRARGTLGGEILELHVDGNVVDTWTMSTSYYDYYANGSGSNIELHFTNDDSAENGMDIQVDYIIYNNTTYQTEDQATNTAVYVDGACGGSYSEWLHCDGYVLFSVGGGGNLGDVNSDGSIDVIDALLVAQYYVGLNPSNFDSSVADTNCDGTINIVDALLIAQYYVGLVSQFC